LLAFNFEPVNGVVEVLRFDVGFTSVFVTLKTLAERGYRLNGGERYYRDTWQCDPGFSLRTENKPSAYTVEPPETACACRAMTGPRSRCWSVGFGCRSVAEQPPCDPGVGLFFWQSARSAAQSAQPCDAGLVFDFDLRSRF